MALVASKLLLKRFKELVETSEASAKLKTSRLPGQPRSTSPEHKQKGTKVKCL
jgi:hypothetical protein